MSNIHKNTSEKNILVLQGGGALGSYQAGAFEALDANGIQPEWVAGVSIGAINAALIAGNPPAQRSARLRAFWELVTSGGNSSVFSPDAWGRGMLNSWSAGRTLLRGAPGFFSPRTWPAAFQPSGSEGASSFYDTAPLHETLLDLVDFDYLNSSKTRFSVGAVNVETGNMTWFDSKTHTITPAHIMASGALPPGFPAVEIDGAFYWDGGLVSNTPLQFVYDERGNEDLCIFQVDLFNARGAVPASVWQVEARAKDIRFSSRTRFNTDALCGLHTTRSAGQRLYDKLPDALKDDPDARALLGNACDPKVTIAHLIYRQAGYENQSKDFEFSRPSMQDHWQAGARDVLTTLNHPDWHARHNACSHVRVFDLAKSEAADAANKGAVK